MGFLFLSEKFKLFLLLLLGLAITHLQIFTSLPRSLNPLAFLIFCEMGFRFGEMGQWQKLEIFRFLIMVVGLYILLEVFELRNLVPLKRLIYRDSEKLVAVWFAFF